MKKLLLFVLVLVAAFATDLQAQKKKKKKGDQTEESAKPTKKKGDLKEYAEVITEDAITDEGLITSHRVGDDYYFEIPVDLLEKEILVVSRISGHVKGLNFGGAGMRPRWFYNPVIRFQKKGNKILMRSVSYSSIADEDDPIYTSVKNNNFEPIIESFSLETITADSSAYVINMSEFFSNDIPMIR